MPHGIFRREALEAKRNAWLGDISLTQPPSIWPLTIFFTALALCIVLFSVFGTYTRRERVAGQLVPNRGLVTVVSPSAGIVTKLSALEGSSVKSGELLALVTIPSVTSLSKDTIKSLQSGVVEKEKGLEGSEAGELAQLDSQSTGLAAQIRSSKQEQLNLMDEIGIQKTQLELAKDTLTRYKKAEADQVITTIQVRQQEALVLSEERDIQALKREIIVSQRGVAELKQRLSMIDGQRQAVLSKYRHDQAALDQEKLENAMRGSVEVNSTVDGIISHQLIKPGQSVETGQPLLVVMPDNSRLEAELFVPSHSIGFIKVGDTVLMRYQAFPYQKFGHYQGKVSQISRSALTLSEIERSGIKQEQYESLYRVIVRPKEQSVPAYGKKESLRPNMVLEADILGEKRTLLEWAFEPIISLKGIR